MDSFTLQGTINGVPATIAWNDQEGFTLDTSGAVADAVSAGTQVEASATGPFYLAAATPAIVALLTALSVFDGQVAQGDDGAVLIQDALDELTTLPPKATA